MIIFFKYSSHLVCLSGPPGSIVCIHVELGLSHVRSVFVRKAMERVVTFVKETAFCICRAWKQVREFGWEVLCVVSLVELGLARRGHCLAADFRPVNLVEPRV